MTQTKSKNRVVRSIIPPPEMLTDIEDMLKAAAVMKDADGVKHVKTQAALIFDRFHEAQSVAALEVKSAQENLKRLTKELEVLRRERRTLPAVQYQLKDEETGNDNEIV
jgi:hypothetical protein